MAVGAVGWLTEAYGEDEWLYELELRRAAPDFYVETHYIKIPHYYYPSRGYSPEEFISAVQTVRLRHRTALKKIDKYIEHRIQRAPLIAITTMARAKWINYVRIRGKDPEAVRREIFIKHCEKVLDSARCKKLYEELRSDLNTPLL